VRVPAREGCRSGAEPDRRSGVPGRSPPVTYLTVRRQGAASDLTRQFHIARTCSEPRNDATCRSFARIWLLPCEALTPAMLQPALRHCFWMVPSNSRWTERASRGVKRRRCAPKPREVT
jgi:hypothetical protein